MASTGPSQVGEARPDVSLAERIRRGDASAETELVRYYGRTVTVIAGARTGDYDIARDLAQDILVAVLKALRRGNLREPDKLSAFVQGTARNIINNYLRERTRRAEQEITDLDCPAYDPTTALEDADRRRVLGEALQSLNATDRDILRLSLIDGLSCVEVAARIELSHEAVRARKSRALRKLMEKFRKVSQS